MFSLFSPCMYDQDGDLTFADSCGLGSGIHPWDWIGGEYPDEGKAAVPYFAVHADNEQSTHRSW